MLVAQPTRESSRSHFGAVATRQFSVWPFAARTARLCLLVDPSLPDQSLRRGLLRAMHQAYFRSDGCSQTRAVREAALAAHYVLRDHNRDVLQLDQFSAASAVAALRGDVAFVALAGDAAAFVWRGGALTGRRGIVRLPRPLGLESEPCITLWSTPLDTGDRLVLVCGAAWKRDSQQGIEDILRAEDDPSSRDAAEQRLAEALGGARPAGVLMVEPSGRSVPERGLTLVSTDRRAARGSPSSTDVNGAMAPRPCRSTGRRLASSLLAIALLAGATLAALKPTAASPGLTAASQAQVLLAQADQTADLRQAHALVASALDLAQNAASSAPGENGSLVTQVAQKLDQVDRVLPVTPTMVVRLGSSGSNVVDLAVGDTALYTLDVVESSVRAFGLDARDQQPTPDTLLVRSGVRIGPGARRLAPPVAIRYLSGPRPELGVLAVVDQDRSVLQIGRDRALTPQPVPGSAAWGEIGALGGDLDGHLFVLDSGSRQLFEYPPLNQRPVDPPRLLLDSASAPGVSFDKAAEVVGQQGQLYLRMDDGSVRRFDAQGTALAFAVQPPDGQLTAISAVTADRAAGLYLADPAHARILHTTADGAVVRQLRDPLLAGVRQIQSSPDGRRLYGLVAAGVLVFDVPE